MLQHKVVGPVEQITQLLLTQGKPGANKMYKKWNVFLLFNLVWLSGEEVLPTLKVSS